VAVASGLGSTRWFKNLSTGLGMADVGALLPSATLSGAREEELLAPAAVFPTNRDTTACVRAGSLSYTTKAQK
jgi:hypothetical protein